MTADRIYLAIAIVFSLFISFLIQAFNSTEAYDFTPVPLVIDPNLSVEPLVEDLKEPTNMAFLDDNTLLVAEKGGDIRVVSNGQLQEKPLLRVEVNGTMERGLVGLEIVVDEPESNGTAVYLYYTEPVDGQLNNRVYKYSWNGHALINKTLLLDLPGTPGPVHNGGKLVFGPDKYLYVVIGDLTRRGKLQNVLDGQNADNTSVIFRIDPNDGSAAPKNPFASKDNDKLNDKYYAYGIRNSFGIAFDPISGKLWDTENGEDKFDEINLVEPGFNSGSSKIMGPSTSITNKNISVVHDLVYLPGSYYREPALSWIDTIAITDLEFLTSAELGLQYNNTLFVGNWNTGNLFNLKLNSNRSALVLDDPLDDLIVNNDNEVQSIIFGAGFGRIVDIQTGPDGLLYVLNFGFNDSPVPSGSIYRIKPLVKD